jgi:hypothetical protein
MPATPPPLWDGYDDAGQDALEALLDGKVDAAVKDDDPTVNEDVARNFAAVIASQEKLKAELGAPNHFPRLQAEAERIRDADIGSWRPK